MTNVDTINCITNIRAYYVNNDKHKKMSYTLCVYDVCTDNCFAERHGVKEKTLMCLFDVLFNLSFHTTAHLQLPTFICY